MQHLYRVSYKLDYNNRYVPRRKACDARPFFSCNHLLASLYPIFMACVNTELQTEKTRKHVSFNNIVLSRISMVPFRIRVMVIFASTSIIRLFVTSII